MPLNPTQKQKVRTSISVYSGAAVLNEPRIHYSQQRPFPYIDHIGEGFHTLDCSGFVGNCFWNAMHDTGIYLHDPLDEKYRGIGYTGTLETYLRRSGKRIAVDAQPILVGDIARWGQGLHAHTAICSTKGTATSAWFTSHGREGGPNKVRLHYRDDLVGVWRHPALL